MCVRGGRGGGGRDRGLTGGLLRSGPGDDDEEAALLYLEGFDPARPQHRMPLVLTVSDTPGAREHIVAGRGGQVVAALLNMLALTQHPESMEQCLTLRRFPLPMKT